MSKVRRDRERVQNQLHAFHRSYLPSTRSPMASPRERSIFSLYDSPRRRDADRPSRSGLVGDQGDLAVGSGQSVLRFVIVRKVMDQNARSAFSSRLIDRIQAYSILLSL